MSSEFTGGVFSEYRVRVNPPSVRLVVTPEQLEFHPRGIFRILGSGPWTVRRDQVTEVFAKKRRPLPPRVWDVQITTTDPSVWWTFWSYHNPDSLLLALEQCGYPVDWRPHNWAGSPIE